MRRRRFLPLVVSAVLLALSAAGCAPRKKVPHMPPVAPPPGARKAMPLAMAKEADGLFAQEKFREAAELYERVIQNFPQSPILNEIRWRLALCYHRLGDAARTERTLRDLVGLDLPVPRKVKVLSLMAESHRDLKRPLEALRWYLAALRTAEADQLKAEVRGRIRKLLSEDTTETELREVSYIYPRTYPAGYAKFLLAQRLFRAGRIESSRKLLSEVLRFYGEEDFSPEVEAFLGELEQFVPDQYVLGCILPLSGRGASLSGEPSLRGLELAVHAFEPDYNDLNLRLVIKDSRASPGRAAEAVEELVREEGVLAIIGPLFRGTSEAAAAKAQELRVPLITLTTKEDIAQQGDFIFRNGLSYTLQIRLLVTYAMEGQGLRRFAVFYPEDGYGKALSSLFIDEVYRQGGEVVALESYQDTQMDFGREIKRMVKIEEKESTGRGQQTYYRPVIQFDAIFIPDQADRIALIAPQLAFYNVYGVTLLGTNAWHNQELLEKAGRFIQGALLVDGFFGESQSPGVVDFVDRYRGTFSEDPTILAAQAYDAAAIVISLLEDHPILSREAMRDELLQARNFSGVSGFRGFDATGNAKKSPFLLTVQGNAFNEVPSHLVEEIGQD
ncbi:MAG: penicillin-binding protein activator [Deltaproteobacteria bacterium]|nr:penicillin-binding protein activator [Deltaproteobacteria bacterium]MBW2120870.1 penicillin-binding protein activator [Deltaproteobacteria bacterium]